jgi:hypothetical protein
MFFAGTAKVSRWSCNDVSPDLQQCLAEAATILLELQRHLAGGVKLSCGSCKAIQQELQRCLAGAANKVQRSTVGATRAIGGASWGDGGAARRLQRVSGEVLVGLVFLFFSVEPFFTLMKQKRGLFGFNEANEGLEGGFDMRQHGDPRAGKFSTPGGRPTLAYYKSEGSIGRI